MNSSVASSDARLCKDALNTLTLSLARCLAPAIRVNAILPGMVDSDWLRERLGAEQFQAKRERYEARALLKDVITPTTWPAQPGGWPPMRSR
jgi:NAD(P)-dependent dehydrogenase (short-subunit alcohol dehydrogenase family)